MKGSIHQCLWEGWTTWIQWRSITPLSSGSLHSTWEIQSVKRKSWVKQHEIKKGKIALLEMKYEKFGEISHRNHKNWECCQEFSHNVLIASLD